MIGDKLGLDVYISTEQIARIDVVNEQLLWSYCNTWRESGYPISPFLPLKENISPINVQRFLKNLLPEGHALDELLATFHLSKNNIFGLIQALGSDTPGSLIILTANQSLSQQPSFRLILDEELTARLDNRERYNLIIWDGKPRLSVAGVQDKINVVLNKENELGFGEGSFCSTHILKFEKQKYSHLVLNEYLSMRLANKCGLKVAEVELKRFGHHPALLVTRFDRKLDVDNTVKRRHIIDGCQALNLPPEYKYEQNFGSGRDVAHIRDGASLPRLFQFANSCIHPAKTKLQILDWVLFNILIFNADAHGKNISFFISKQGISLTPFYDLVNIKMYPEFKNEMAMALGDEFDGQTINAYQLADFADSCEISRALVATRLRYLIKRLNVTLSKEIKGLMLNKEEQEYLRVYQELVTNRCVHLLKQSNLVVSMQL